ncbi:MAG: ATP-binding cassette domain-containing protein [Chloroflexota bacterium]
MSDSSPAIQVNLLNKTYQVPEREAGLRASLGGLFHRRTRSVPAVRGISFSLEAGEVVGFLGPNGAGKTTTLNWPISSPSSGRSAFRSRC